MTRPLRTLRTLSVVPLLVLLAAGCGGGDSDDSSGTSGDEPITPGAVAVIALDHLDAEASRLVPMDTEEDGSRTIGTRLDFEESAYDPDTLFVGVADKSTDWSCESEEQSNDGCETTQLPSGTLTVIWQEVEPEEDPGIVTVVLQRDAEDVIAFYAGDLITGDPRDQDLFVDVSTMIDIVTDERMRVTTTSDAVEAGEDVAWTEDES